MKNPSSIQHDTSREAPTLGGLGARPAELAKLPSLDPAEHVLSQFGKGLPEP